MNFTFKDFTASGIDQAIEEAQAFLNNPGNVQPSLQHLVKIASTDGQGRPSRVVIFYPLNPPAPQAYTPPNTQLIHNPPYIGYNEGDFSQTCHQVVAALDSLGESHQVYAKVCATDGDGVPETITLWY